MTTTNFRLSPATAGRAPGSIGAGLQAFFANVAAIFDVLLRVRQVHINGQKMADMLREADRLEATSPVRAAALRNAAHRITLV